MASISAAVPDVTSSFDKTARLWDADTGAEVRVFEGHEHVVACASFSPDGRRIVTASADKTARLWEADDTGEPMTLEAIGQRLGLTRERIRQLRNGALQRIQEQFGPLLQDISRN